ncbi:hypothetical protein FQA39_LY11354 [Lamprigera yunnana]|nr:hypothetical protein FQA39_LY11354 [Lamprigera yunnana]
MEKAHLRELKQTNQCELVFQLKLTNAKSEVIIDEEIHSVRACTDVIESLLSHTERKITKMLEMKNVLDMKITTSLVINGVDVKGDTNCKQFMDKPKKNIIFTILKQSFEVIINAPLVKELLLPNVIFVNYSYQPTKFKSIYTNKELSEFIWYSSSDKVVWTEVHRSFKYKPTMNDLDKYLKLKCIPRNSQAEGSAFETICEITVAKVCVPTKCPFNERHLYTNTWVNEKNQIRVASYNILSNLYAENFSQPLHCSPHALSIHYRKQLILKELLGYRADIICLQEVDQCIFNLYLKPKLFKMYKGLFHKKGFKISEGLACFFNSEKFKLLESKQLVFGEELRTNSLFKHTWNLIVQCNTLKDCIVKQPTSLQVTVLKSKVCDEIVIIANTHLYYHSKANLVRLLQSSIALDYIDDVCNRHKRFTKSRVSVIFCGDFNSAPTSELHQFIMNGFIQCTFETDIENSQKTLCLHHSFKFGSAYGTPKYTNYTIDFKGCLDYIFYDSTCFSVIDCVPLPDESVLAENIALPNEVFPSDHLALVCNLKSI